jgi:hypothetical protein
MQDPSPNFFTNLFVYGVGILTSIITKTAFHNASMISVGQNLFL